MLSDNRSKPLKPPARMSSSPMGGLYLRVSVHGTKTFIFRKKTNGITRYATLGEYPHLTLSDARTRASELQGKTISILTLEYAVSEYLKHLDFEHPTNHGDDLKPT